MTQEGIADEQLARKEVERGRKRALEDDDEPTDPLRKRSRSFSSTSVSTISTSISRSPSPKRSRRSLPDPPPATTRKDPAKDRGHRKRPRSPSISSSRSYSSYSSSASEHGAPQGSRGRASAENRSTRRRRSSVSPGLRGRERGNHTRESRSRTDSMDRSRIARHRNSMTPDVRPRHGSGAGSIPDHRAELRDRESFGNNRRYSNDGHRYGAGARDQEPGGSRFTKRAEASGGSPPSRNQPPPIRKERSLSPFSKRLALTQAMNLGR
ncbi:hypothetical protein MMC25_006938 [Agyrium rufum]|nr:hypothetical protein [Agyrium rufum]